MRSLGALVVLVAVAAHMTTASLLAPNGKPKTLVVTLLDALVDGRVELYERLAAPNCTYNGNGSFPTGVPENSNNNNGKLALFRVVPGSLGEANEVAVNSNKPFLTIEKGSSGGDKSLVQEYAKFARYLPLLNSVSDAAKPLMARSGFKHQHQFVVRMTRSSPHGAGADADAPFFATVDMQAGVLTLNADLLRYLPDEPSPELVKLYASMAEDIAKLESFDEASLSPLLAIAFTRLQDLYQANPIACFFCIAIGAPIVAVIANAAMARLGLKICEVCELSDETCNAVVLYLVMLVYQNLPLLAAILMRICGDFCIEAMGHGF